MVKGMRVVFTQRSKGQIEFGIIYGCIAFIALCSARFLPLFSLLPDCAFKRITGISCPTCGATHSIVHLAHGNVVAAFLSNPLISIALSVALFALLFGLIAFSFQFPRIEVSVSAKEDPLVRIVAVVFFLIHWAYLIISS